MAKTKKTTGSALPPTNSPTAIKKRVRNYMKTQTAPLHRRLKDIDATIAKAERERQQILRTLEELGDAAGVSGLRKKKSTKKKRGGKRSTKKKSTKRGRASAEVVEARRKKIAKRATTKPKGASELLGGIEGATTADLRALVDAGELKKQGAGRGTVYTGK